MTNKLLIWGAGGHAKVVYDLACAAGYADICFIDEGATAPTQLLGREVTLPSAVASPKTGALSFVIAIGSNEARALLR